MRRDLRQKSRAVEKKAPRYRCAHAGQEKLFVGCKKKLARAVVQSQAVCIFAAKQTSGHQSTISILHPSFNFLNAFFSKAHPSKFLSK